MTEWPVMLYVPNLIGYMRVFAMIASFYVASGCAEWLDECQPTNSNYKLAIFLYFMNFAGDVVDGYAARFFNQCSKYGGVLDMVTDRVSTAGLCALLAVLYPKEMFTFVSLIVIDIFSHWFHVVYSEQAQRHHKGEQTNWFLKWYYGCYPLFAYCCVSQEFYYIGRWALKFLDQDLSSSNVELFANVINYVFLPGCVMKQVVNFAQWWNAASHMAEADKEARDTKAK